MIRPPRHDELEHLRDIERAAGELFAAVGMPDVAADEPLPAAVLDTYGKAGWAWVITVDGAGGAPVGYLVADVLDDPGPGPEPGPGSGLGMGRAAHVEQVSVHPDHAGLGLGRRLLEHVVAVARRRGLDAVTLTTFRDVPWNAPYYARCGFRVVPEAELGPGLRRVRDAEARHGLDPALRVCMRRDIGPELGDTG